MKLLFNVLLMLPFSLYAQPKGIHFEEGVSWKAIKAKARAEHKLIFMDCFATWCGPCKMMAQRIFPLDEVGRVMNEKFVCVGVQMDSTVKDNQEVRNWYADARRIEKEYKVGEYPTFLFFNAEGQPLHKTIGAMGSSEEFLAKVNDALDENKQYFTLMGHYRQHLNDSAYLRNAIIAALTARDEVNAASIGDAYADCIKNLFAKDNLRLILGSMISSRNRGFDILLHHGTEVDTSLGINTAEKTLVWMIRKEEINPLTKKDNTEVDWKGLYARLKEKYPQQAQKAVLGACADYYAIRKRWKEYGPAIVEYVDKVDDHHDMDRLNDFAWNIFLKCDDFTVLASALNWSRFTFSNDSIPDDNRIDTYANLLYKSGDVKGAICWEQKAMSLVAAKSNNKQRYNFHKYAQTIERMQRGEKVWENPL